jgi:hypothetical protein
LADGSIQKVVPEDFVSKVLSQLRAMVINFNQLVNRNSIITVIFSIDFNLIRMPEQQLNQAIPNIFMQLFTQQLISLSTGVSIQFLGRKLEVDSLNDSTV